MILFSLTFASCGFMSALTGYNFDHYNKVYITDYSEKMATIKLHFPEIYDLYRDGLVIIDEVYEYKDKNGKSKIHVGYRYR